MQLELFGWSADWQKLFASSGTPGTVPGRVTQVQRGLRWVRTETAESEAIVAAGLDGLSAPVVGDWVACSPPGGGRLRIEAVLSRKTLLARKSPGRVADPQPVAANLDKVLLVSGLDHDFNLRRIERLLVMVYESGAVPLVVLNKADLHPDPKKAAGLVETVAPGVEVLLVSAVTGLGTETLLNRLASHETVALIGSSGAGKSSLINRFFGSDFLVTGPVREDDSRGRHTTTHRELFCHPSGVLFIDNPGIRELQLWASEDDLDRAFGDIAELAAQCRFRDCTHLREPGCAVLEAVAFGRLQADRLESYQKLNKEIRYLESRTDVRARLEEKRKWKAIHRSLRHFKSSAG